VLDEYKTKIFFYLPSLNTLIIFCCTHCVSYMPQCISGSNAPDQANWQVHYLTKSARTVFLHKLSHINKEDSAQRVVSPHDLT
jgi:hypothetical protein